MMIELDGPLRIVPTTPTYTLPQLSALAREYVEAARERWGEQDMVEVELQLSLFLAWIQNSEKKV
jgi:hypothetical protein